MVDPFKNALSFLKQVEEHLSAEDKRYLQRLGKPDNVLKSEIELEMDDGKVKKLPAFRVQYNNALGPYKGGIRFHQAASEEEIKTLAFWMVIKSAAVGLPFGGAKGGVVVDPKALSKGELERLSRSFTRFIAPDIGERKDIPAPDLNTNPQIIAWMVDEFEKIKKAKAPAAFTGKPPSFGGSRVREKATGFGGVLVLKRLVEKLKKKDVAWAKKPISQISLAIQGFGNVGYHFAKTASDEGFKVVAVSDSKGAVYVEEGLDPLETLRCKEEKGTLAGCYCVGGVCDLKQGKTITNEALLELETDILVPAALENVITDKNAAKIRAKAIIEMANGPTTPAGDKILNQKGIIVAPDILANSAGVTSSYFEWAQNLSGFFWEEEEVEERLKRMMKKSFERIWEKYLKLRKKTTGPEEKTPEVKDSKTSGVKNGNDQTGNGQRAPDNGQPSLRLAAYILAVERIIEAERLRRP